MNKKLYVAGTIVQSGIFHIHFSIYSAFIHICREHVVEGDDSVSFEMVLLVFFLAYFYTFMLILVMGLVRTKCRDIICAVCR